MKTLKLGNRFKKDATIAQRRGCDGAKLQAIVNLLVADEPLPQRCRPHKLQGEWQDYWECHIAPDWLLIYTFSETEVVLHRTGTHSDLF